MCKSSEPFVSIITVNYKQTGVTMQLLDSLRHCTYKNTEVLIVDNGSGEGLENLLHTTYPEVKCITSKENLGFAGGNNLAIVESKGKYLLFLNNDTEVEPGFLEPMVKLLEEDPSIGLVSPKILFYDTENTIQYAGSGGINPFTGRAIEIGSLKKDDGQYTKIHETSLGHGAAMMLPRNVIEKVGMMPDVFFLYYEEHDWCEAIKRAGFKVFYVGSSVVYHKESVSVGKRSTLKTFYMARNRLLFLRRNNGLLAYLSSLLFFLFLAVPKHTILYILEGKWDHLVAFYKGIVWNVTHYKVYGFPSLPKA